MRTLKTSRGNLCLFMIFLLFFISCSKDEPIENPATKIVLDASKSSIAADGIDNVNFSVNVFDENEKLISNSDAKIYLDGVAQEDFTFSTLQTGLYQFQAKVHSISSNIVTVIALSEQDLKVASINLKTNTRTIIANNQSQANLELEFKDAQGNVLKGINYDLQANGVSLPNLNFKTGMEGEYVLKGFVNGVESNSVTINARPDIVYEEITIPVIFHIVHVGEAVGEGSNLSASIPEGLIERLNLGFSNGFDAQNPNAVDTKIRFRLATKGENGETLNEPGINRIDGRIYDVGTQNRMMQNAHKPPLIANYYVSKFNNIDFNSDTAGDNHFGRDELDLIASQENWDMHYYYNIILAPFEEKVNASGYARYPVLSQPDVLEGLVVTTSVEQGEAVNANIVTSAVDSESITYLDGHFTTIHETGHFLGLKHVFSQNECETSDYCSDTYSYKSGDINAACEDNRGVDVRDNIMDYSPERSNFTYEQRERMQKVLEYAFYIKDLKNSTK